MTADGARQSNPAQWAAVPRMLVGLLAVSPRDVTLEVAVRVLAGNRTHHNVARFGPGS